MSEIENNSEELETVTAELLDAEVETEVKEAKKPVKEEEAETEDEVEAEEEEDEVTESADDEDESDEDEVAESAEDESDEEEGEEEAEEDEIEESTVDHSADLDALVANEDSLSEDFRVKATAIFEAATTAKLVTEIDRLEEQYAENLETEVADITATLADKVDAYLAYVVESWISSNEVAIDNGLRTEIAEDFMSSLHSVFKENYIEVPESKVDLVDELVGKVAKLEESLNTTTEDNVRLTESVRVNERAEIVRKYSDGLATTEAEKLGALVEGVEFVDAETFEMKVSVIAESYFAEAHTGSAEEVENVIGNEASTVVESSAMSVYTAALSKN